MSRSRGNPRIVTDEELRIYEKLVREYMRMVFARGVGESVETGSGEPRGAKGQSDLHGDVERLAETISPTEDL